MSRSRYLYNLLLRLWPLGKVLNRLGNQPVLGSLLRPCFSTDGNEAIIIPVQETVPGTENVVLPFPLLDRLVEQSSTYVVMKECMCRRAENCQTYLPEIGCLFLGDGAAQIDAALGQPISRDQALRHIHRAVELGLVPLVVHSSFDAWILGIPYRRMLAICFCCDCCCTVRHGLRLGPPAFWDTIVRLPGLELTVGPDCTGCGQCAEACPIGAVVLENGRARIGDSCKGCGRCAALCPTNAITLRLDQSVDTYESLLARIEQRTGAFA
jgi:ferredoxin